MLGLGSIAAASKRGQFKAAKPKALPSIFKRTKSSFSDLDKAANYSENFYEPIPITKTGIDLMNDPLYNKGAGFSYPERDRYHIRGLLPPNYSTLEVQAERLWNRLNMIKDGPDVNIQKFLHLNSLMDRNETAFYKLLIDNIKDVAPLIYTPTVGIVCQKFGFLYRRPRGMYFSCLDRGEMAAMVHNWPSSDVDVVVVTDGSRILGLGDLGANGMGIPIGKCSLYVAAAGIHPSRVLPIMLDVGTNNTDLLQDPFYMGIKQKRITGDDYYSLVDELMWALRTRWPNVLIQFEDFSNDNAFNLLQKYRQKYLCFNDDIQGTGSVALAGIYSALRIQNLSASKIREQRVVCMGAGSAGLGVVYSLYDGMMAQGMNPLDAAKNFYLIDKDGLLTIQRSSLNSGQLKFARTDLPEGMSLLDVVKKVKPTILLGLSGVGGLFTEDVVKEMASHVKQPILFPLSNPTDKAECTAEQAFTWTEGRAIFASGSPFQPVKLNGKTYYPSQGNNMFIYPGMGLAAVAVGMKRITPQMFSRAAEVLSTCVSRDYLDLGMVYPDVTDIRRVSIRVASEICQMAFNEKLATKSIPDGMTLERYIESTMYRPVYHPYIVEK